MGSGVGCSIAAYSGAGAKDTAVIWESGGRRHQGEIQFAYKDAMNGLHGKLCLEWNSEPRIQGELDRKQRGNPVVIGIGRVSNGQGIWTPRCRTSEMYGPFRMGQGRTGLFEKRRPASVSSTIRRLWRVNR